MVQVAGSLDAFTTPDLAIIADIAACHVGETHFFTTTGADALGGSTGKNQYCCNNFPRKDQRILRNYY